VNEWYKILIVAGLAYASAFTVQWWKVSRDEFKSGIDDLCKLIDEAAHAGSEYWLTAAEDPRRGFLEARVSGLQERLAGLHFTAFKRLAKSQSDPAVDCILRLMRALTWDGFYVADRPSNPELAREVQLWASRSVVAARSAFAGSLSIRAMLRKKLGL
jgi:hypothetical protein